MWDHAEHTWCFVQETSSSVPGPLGGFSGLSRRMAATALWSHSRNGWQSLRQGFKAIDTSSAVQGQLWEEMAATVSQAVGTLLLKSVMFFLWFVLPSCRHFPPSLPRGACSMIFFKKQRTVTPSSIVHRVSHMFSSVRAAFHSEPVAGSPTHARAASAEAAWYDYPRQLP